MKKHLGQYFTTNIVLQEKVLQFIMNEPEIILEPSCGRGDLIRYIQLFMDVSFDAIELDENLDFVIDKSTIIFSDFFDYSFTKKYKTIVGNPPYVKIKSSCNLYLLFIEKCIDLLEDEGELIFIVPSDVFELTSAKKINEKMIENGRLTHIFRPNLENLFEGASIDVVIFRYIKTESKGNVVIYNDEDRYCRYNDGLIQFVHSNDESNLRPLKDFFNVYVGMVSGRESVFKNDEFGNIDVITNEDVIEKYIYIKSFPTEDDNLNNYMLEFKDELLNRRIKKFTSKNWFEWGALRNIKKIEENIEKDCIYIKTVTRSETVAFVGKVSYFNGNLIILIPIVDIDLDSIVKYINSLRMYYTFSGRFKITHKQVSSILLE